jgi:hypothetical protein
MIVLLAGIALLVITVAIFFTLLPRNGETYRFAGSPWEPYVGVGLTCGIAISMAMTISGALNVFGG